MAIHDIDTSNLPPVESVDAAHREQMTAIIRQYTDSAATDAAALEIVERLIRESSQGMTFDEEGGRTSIHIEDEADYWSDSQISASSQTGSAGQPSRTQQLLALGGMVAAILFILWMVFGGRTSAAETENGMETPAVFAGGQGEADPLLGVGIIEESSLTEADLLALSDNLGVRTRMGQPATVEIVDSRTNSSITLGVINTPVQNRSVPIAEQMVAGQPVVQWVVGTVVNYVMGIPAAVMEQTAVGNTILVRTDTGATYAFTCTEREMRSGQETEIFLQDRPGVTLFPLPSPRSPVPVLWCPYDPTREDVMLAGGVTYSPGDVGEIGGIRFSVTEVTLNQTIDGQLAMDVTGNIQAISGFGSVVIGLNTDAGRYSPRGDQFQAAEVEQRWLAQFLLPYSLINNQLYLDVRSPTGGSMVIDLGLLRDPAANAQVALGSATWDDATREVEITVYITNDGLSDVRLTAADFSASQGGVIVPIRNIEPMNMPVLAGANRQTAIVFRLSPTVGGGPVALQTLSTVWEIQNIP